jgi:hypothetical protein
MIPENLDLEELVHQLRAALGDADPVGYLRGKSLMRNALVHQRRISELEAEEMIDTLEMGGFLRYLGDPTQPSQADARWELGSPRSAHSNTNQPNRGK